jgi:hypothetical protein
LALILLALGAWVGAGRGVLVCVIGGAALVFGAEHVCLVGVLAAVLAPALRTCSAGSGRTILIHHSFYTDSLLVPAIVVEEELGRGG